MAWSCNICVRCLTKLTSKYPPPARDWDSKTIYWAASAKKTMLFSSRLYILGAGEMIYNWTLVIENLRSWPSVEFKCKGLQEDSRFTYWENWYKKVKKKNITDKQKNIFGCNWMVNENHIVAFILKHEQYNHTHKFNPTFKTIKASTHLFEPRIILLSIKQSKVSLVFTQ